MICDQGSLVGLCMRDYTCLCASVTILPPWLAPRHTDRQTESDRQNLISLY